MASSLEGEGSGHQLLREEEIVVYLLTHSRFTRVSKIFSLAEGQALVKSEPRPHTNTWGPPSDSRFTATGANTTTHQGKGGLLQTRTALNAATDTASITTENKSRLHAKR